jgi:hypothetical protein
MRQAARHTSILTLYGQHLERLQSSVDSGNILLLERITNPAAQSAASRNIASSAQYHSGHDIARGPDIAMNIKSKRYQNSRSYRCRLPLSAWLVGSVWELGVRQCNSVWTLQFSPVNIRPGHTYAFDFVRAGDIGSVRELLKAGHLSIHDRDSTGTSGNTLLEVSSMHQ